MNINQLFTHNALRGARASARQYKVKVPKGLVARRVSRNQYAVCVNGLDHYVRAYDAAEAKAEYINGLVRSLPEYQEED